MTREEAEELLKDVRANMAKLATCKLHAFNARPPGASFAFRHTCANCGGLVSSDSVVWYNRGIEHANKL